MVREMHRSHNHKPRRAIPGIEVRVSLIRQGHSLRSWATAQGVSLTLVRRIISGERPGVRGESARIRTALLALVRKERAA